MKNWFRGLAALMKIQRTAQLLVFASVAMCLLLCSQAMVDLQRWRAQDEMLFRSDSDAWKKFEEKFLSDEPSSKVPLPSATRKMISYSLWLDQIHVDRKEIETKILLRFIYKIIAITIIAGAGLGFGLSKLVDKTNTLR